MLRISLPSLEVLNESTQEFTTIGGIEVDLEHSLYTMSLWESKYKKPFMSDKTNFKDMMNYYQCMCMTENVPQEAWLTMTPEIRNTIDEYIGDSQTATTIRHDPMAPKGKKRTITSEIIYYWMFSLGIPMECEHWHLNRLMTLIEVCSIESQPKKKMKPGAAIQQQRELNALRRAQLGTKG